MRVNFILRQSARPIGQDALRFHRRSPNLLRKLSTNANTRLPNLDLLAIDKKWKQRWKEDASFQLKKHHGNEKAYILTMFPYPSGSLHMGHVRVYTISDVLARYKHMKGYDVLHPMGWDAFGLPAENAAIERGINPADWTKQNIANMKEQFMGLGLNFDWDREIMTCSPSFYKHTQRLFLLLHEKGLAYQAKAMVNYDPVDKTVLANEQVDANGCSWRSGAKVEKLNLKQWFFRTTAFKEALLKDMDTLVGGWPERILTMQRHWLGKSQGARVRFEVTTPDDPVKVEVFTTRPDTLHGVQYLALSTTHPLVSKLADRTPALKTFIESVGSLPSDTKAGYRLPGVEAVNPLRSLEKNPHLPATIPVYVAPYVLSDYGEGAVMGVPGHDSRDFAFWAENASSEPPMFVVGSQSPNSSPQNVEPNLGHGVMTDLCGSYSGMQSREAGLKIVADLQQKNNMAQISETWRLRDWLISRQRYWGAPIPIIHCGDCGPVPVPADQLPVELPEIEGSGLKGKTGNPLESAENWLHTTCPSCGGPAKRDTDTMDTFVDSSWYFLRFLDASNENMLFSPELARPVDTYIGGIEHAILHLLYSRFIYKALAKEGMIPNASDSPEPFTTLLSQGMVHGKTYSDPATGRFLKPGEVDLSKPASPMLQGTEIKANISFEKMSKSKYNGVDPNVCIDNYGADATRAHILFSAPVSEVLEWDEAKIVGIQRWFGRLWKIVSESRQTLESGNFSVTADNLKSINTMPLPPVDQLSESEAQLLLNAHQTISSISRCLESNPYGLNTVISDLTKLTNAIAATSLPSNPSCPTLYIVVSSLLRLLAPISPALASECWESLHTAVIKPTATPELPPSVFASPWPSSLLSESQIESIRSRSSQTVAVQINGKLRFTASIPRFSPDSSQDTEQTASIKEEKGKLTPEQEWIISHLLETEGGKVWLQQKHDWEKRRRVIVVRGGKVVNVVF